MRSGAALAIGESQVPLPARSNEVSVRIARDLNALMRAMALRAVVYVGEQECPFDEEFDGNDFTACTHLLAERDGQPVGTMRIRWFAEFVKFERAAVDSRCRGAGIAQALMWEAIEIARRRGYTKGVGYSQVRLASYWAEFGFRVRPDRAPFVWSDHEYVEIEIDLVPHPRSLTIDTPPLELMRPDGEWDAAGVLDRSAARPATNPHK